MIKKCIMCKKNINDNDDYTYLQVITELNDSTSPLCSTDCVLTNIKNIIVRYNSGVFKFYDKNSVGILKSHEDDEYTLEHMEKLEKEFYQ